MRAQLLLGDEAVAQAALDAGIGGAFSYPGTPATEVFEYIQAHKPDGLPAMWSANEKVAYEEALGMSYAGKRAIVSMKHVGLNVASDAFINSALTGVGGALVLVVADDPGMHSSQNEQDSRFYGEFAQVPMFEPSTQQEAYDQTLEAFDYSEKIGLPVMIRLVTRLSHSRANVICRPEPVASDNGEALHETWTRPDPNDWVLVPVNARRRFRRLLEMQGQLVDDADRSPHNSLRLAGRRGIIAAGIAYNYTREALGTSQDDSLLKISAYPLPVGLIRTLVDHCEEIYVFEDGYPFIEKRLRGLLGVPGKAIKGKLSGDLAPDGELSPDAVAAALGTPLMSRAIPLADLAGRPPQLCRGCPHADSYKAIIEATAGFERSSLFSDIGCYTLGVLPPFRAVHSCVDMGSSIAMAHGAAQAGMHPVLCTIGDSTFGHSGMTPLMGAARADANITVFILDNATVAMTGAQESMTCGEDLLRVIRGLGVSDEHLHVIDPLAKHHDENVAIIRKEIEHRGLSVIVPVRACIHVKRKVAPAVQVSTSCACAK
jgi:indolepyruvate ferredoxin oxidoreductase alpha subunit